MTDALEGSAGAVPIYEVDFVHELLWEQIKRMFMVELQEQGSKMGTVSVTPTGAKVSVKIDGKSISRQVDRVAGRRFRVGDRVVLVNANGRLVAVGATLNSTSLNDTGVIDDPDIAPGAVKRALTRDGVTFTPPDRSLTWNMIATGQIFGSAAAAVWGGSHISAGTIGAADIGDGQVGNAKISGINSRKINWADNASERVIPAWQMTRIGSNDISAAIRYKDDGSPVWTNDVIGVQNGNLDTDSVDKRVLADGTVGFQQCDDALKALINKPPKHKHKKGGSTASYTEANEPA